MDKKTIEVIMKDLKKLVSYKIQGYNMGSEYESEYVDIEHIRFVLETYLIKKEPKKTDLLFPKTPIVGNWSNREPVEEPKKKIELLEMDNGVSESRTMKQNIIKIASFINQL